MTDVVVDYAALQSVGWLKLVLYHGPMGEVNDQVTASTTAYYGAGFLQVLRGNAPYAICPASEYRSASECGDCGESE